jgi:hypothetical protein
MLAYQKGIMLAVSCALLVVFAVHEAFPRRSNSLKAWCDLLTETRPGMILSSSEQQGHYVAIERTSDDRAIIWVRHQQGSVGHREMFISMDNPTCSLRDQGRRDGDESIRLSPSWFNGSPRNGEGSATPIDHGVKGEIEFCVVEQIGCGDLLSYRMKVLWQ